MTTNSVRLICFPFAGAGASFFHAWSKFGIDGLEICPVQLAGRERRIADDPFTNMHEAADALLPEVIATAKGEPVALFGHCFMGSVLAYELALRLLDKNPESVRHLFVSASRVPAVAKQFGAEQLSDDLFLDMVKSVTGYRHPAFEIPEMRELLLPALRADFQMDETYLPRGFKALSIPITAIMATNDEFVSKEQVSEWRSYTTSTFELMPIEGGHMYLAENALPLVQLISNQLHK